MIVCGGAIHNDVGDGLFETNLNGKRKAGRQAPSRQNDPTPVPRPPVPASLGEAQVGNLGIHLMRSFASSMRYERRDSRNCLTMRFVEVQDAAHGATMR